MLEGNACKVASPAGGNGNSTDGCGNDVAKCFPHGITLGRISPYTVNGVGVVRLTDTFLPGHLVNGHKQVKYIVEYFHTVNGVCVVWLSNNPILLFINVYIVLTI